MWAATAQGPFIWAQISRIWSKLQAPRPHPGQNVWRSQEAVAGGMSPAPGPLPQPHVCLACLWEATGTILQMRTLQPRRMGLGHWRRGDRRATGGCAGVRRAGLRRHTGRAAVGLRAAQLDSWPCFLRAPSPYGLCDRLQTTLFPKNKHAYGIGGSFVAIKGNNRVFKKITLRFK